VRALGFGHLLSSVRCSADNALRLMNDGDEARATFRALIDDCIGRDGAQHVLLAGGGFIGAGGEFRNHPGWGGIVDCGEATAELVARIVDQHLDFTNMDALVAALRDPGTSGAAQRP
jgi:hypothetical protein